MVHWPISFLCMFSCVGAANCTRSSSILKEVNPYLLKLDLETCIWGVPLLFSLQLSFCFFDMIISKSDREMDSLRANALQFVHLPESFSKGPQGYRSPGSTERRAAGKAPIKENPETVAFCTHIFLVWRSGTVALHFSITSACVKHGRPSRPKAINVWIRCRWMVCVWQPVFGGKTCYPHCLSSAVSLGAKKIRRQVVVSKQRVPEQDHKQTLRILRTTAILHFSHKISENMHVL